MHSNIVKFPRFEFATGATGSTLARRSIEHPWLSPHLATLLTEPTEITGDVTIDQKKLTGWNGVYHEARIKTTIGRLLTTPLHTGGPLLYRGQLVRHEYLWDHQALPGQRTEWVLERLVTDEPRFEEVMALLFDSRHPETQQMVIKRDGHWQQPSPIKDIDRDFYLETSQTLASSTINDLMQDAPALQR